MGRSRAAPAGRRNADGRAYIRVSAKVAALIAGDSDLSDWDDEELMRGQPRDKGGKFRGQPPSLVPREVYAEWARRQMEAGFQDMIGDLRDVVKAVRHIATDETQDASLRLRAAEMVMDRVYGKPRERVDLGVGQPSPAEEIIRSVTIDRDDDDGWAELEAEAGIVDAEIVEDDDEWEFEDHGWVDATREEAWRS